MFSIRQIQYFVTTVKQGSISGAAETLDVSPQAISKAIAEMEQGLTQPLFVRKSTGLKPTTYGMALCKKARKTLHEFDELEKLAEEFNSDTCSKLRIDLCVPRFASFDSVRDRITSFIMKNTNLPTVVKLGNLRACTKKLLEGSIDGFVTLGKTDLPQFSVNVIDYVTAGALMSNRHSYAEKAALVPTDFEEVPLYLVPEFDFFSETVRELLLQSVGEALNFRPLNSSIDGVYRALMKENGCVLVPDINGVGDFFPESIVVPFDRQNLPRVPLCLVTDREFQTASSKTLERLLVEGPMEAPRLDW